MNDQKFHSFIDLVTFDQNFTQLEKKIENSNAAVAKLKADLVVLQKQIETHATKKHDLQKQLDAQELNVKDLQDKEKEKAETVNSVSSTKEHDAASKELERIKFDRSHQEQRMIQMINRVDAAKKEFEVLQAESNAKIASLQEEIQVLQNSLSQTEKELSGLQKERTEKIARVPSEWMELYDNMKGRVSDPVVPVAQDSCSACFYLIASKDLQLLKKQELLQCKDCYRFLYFENK